MFRNWASLSLLIIAPLVLILLIGYAFSSEDLSGLKLGVISEEGMNLDPLRDSVSDYAEFETFGSVEECLYHLSNQDTHICINLEGAFFKQINLSEDVGAVSTGKVVYYYDNTRKKISLVLINKIQDFFGIKSEQISIETTQTIFRRIQDMIAFLNLRKDEIFQIRNESLTMRAQLMERQKNLELTKSRFMTPYNAVKSVQQELHDQSATIAQAHQNMSQNTLLLQNSIIDLKILLTNTTEYQNLTGLSALMILLNEIEEDLRYLNNITNQTVSSTESLLIIVDDLVAKLDKIKLLLDQEIVRNSEYIDKIDGSIERIDALTKELDEELAKLGELSPDLAQKLIRPIEYEFQSYLKGATNIQVSFPLLLVIIIMFISLLFSNISTLMEIQNKAHMRNLIVPVNDLVYVFGLIFTSIIIIFLQIIVLFLVAQVKLGIMISSFFWQLTLISIILITVFVLMGMIFAYVFRNVQSSVLITTFSTLILFLFSNSLSPIESMPTPARYFSSHNPLLLGEIVVKKIQLFKLPLANVSQDMLLLIVYVVVLLAILILIAKNRNKSRT